MLKDLNLKKDMKILMVGTPEVEIEKVNDTVDNSNVVNDFDIEEEFIEIQNRLIFHIILGSVELIFGF